MPYNRATYIPAVPCQFFTNAGAVASGYKLFTYAAGTTTKVTTHTAADLSASNTNPITLDAAGRCTVFLSATFGLAWKFVLATPTTADPPAAGDIIWTRDNVGIVPNSDANIDVLGVATGDLVAGNVVVSNGVGAWGLSDPSEAVKSIDAPRIGVVVSGGLSGEAIIVRLQGASADIGGVLPGTSYYLSATPGELTASAPTGEVHIVPFGWADDSGQVLFPIQSLYRVGARLALKSFGFASGQGNGATTTDTELTSYAVPIPAGILDIPGAHLIVEGVCAVTNSAATKDLKLQLENTSAMTVVATSGGTTMIVPFRIKIFRRAANTFGLNGIAHVNAAAGGAPTAYMANVGTSGVAWDSPQTLKVYAHGSNAADAGAITLTDYIVYPVRSYQGSNV